MLYQTLGVSALYLLVLTVPGYLLISAFGIKKQRFLLSYGISFSILVLTFTAFQILEGTIKGWLYTLGLLYLLILVASTRSARVNFFQQNCTALQKPHRAHALNLKNVDANTLGFLCLSVIIVGYHFYVGPYTEIPSDFWEHLARAEFGLLSIRETLDQPLKLRNLGAIAQPDVIYWGHGLAALPYSASALNAAPGATLALSIIFLGSVYWFSISLVSQGHYSSGLARCSVGLLTALLTAISFGTSTFSYFRYYAYFPTIFCFPIVFLCVQLLVDYQNHPRGNVSNIIGIPFFFAVICLVHIQEFLFALILVYGLIFWRTAKSFLSEKNTDKKSSGSQNLIAAFCVLTIPIAIWVILRYGELRPWGYTPHTVGLPDWLPMLGGLPIANPAFRFWDTLGFFGVLAYIIYFSNWRTFNRYGYVFIGMVSPLLTHFNPLYVYLFLHLNSSTTVWRTSYLMPLAFVVSVFLVTQLANLFAKRSVKRLAMLITTSVLLIATLLPFQIGNYVNRVSRIPSLVPVEVNSGRVLWDDLISKVKEIKDNGPVRGFITDNITQFVIDSAVLGRVPIRQNTDYFPNHNHNYQEDLLTSDFSKYFLIINKRDGQPTGSALYSGHWHPATLNTTTLYPAGIETFIRNYPTNFNLVWSQNSIAIYQMLSPRIPTEPN